MEKENSVDETASTMELSSVREFIYEKLKDSFRNNYPVDDIKELQPIIQYPIGLLIYGFILAMFIYFTYTCMVPFFNYYLLSS